MALASILELLTVLVLAATVPVAVLAFREFRDAPFGHVLRPLPVVFLGYILFIAPQYLEVGLPMTFYAFVSTVAVLGSLLAAFEATMLLTERRAL